MPPPKTPGTPFHIEAILAAPPRPGPAAPCPQPPRWPGPGALPGAWGWGWGWSWGGSGAGERGSEGVWGGCSLLPSPFSGGWLVPKLPFFQNFIACSPSADPRVKRAGLEEGKWGEEKFPNNYLSPLLTQ